MYAKWHNAAHTKLIQMEYGDDTNDSHCSFECVLLKVECDKTSKYNKLFINPSAVSDYINVFLLPCALF